MATQVQRRRGTTAQHSTFTGALGEITVDTDKKTVVVHDGSTAGGFPLVTLAGSEALTNKTINSSAIGGTTPAAGSFTTLSASTSLSVSGVADTATAATHYFVETGSDGFVRPKTLANVRTEVVTTAAVNAAAATTVGTVTSGTWNAGVIGSTYGGTGVNNAGRTLTIATQSGTLTFTGASLTIGASASVSGSNTGDQTLSGLAGTQRTTGFPANNESSVIAADIRNITNPSTGLGYADGVRFRFSSLNDDSASPYADVIDLSTYTDSTGGGYNALYLGKNSQVMQHKWAAAGGTSWTTKTIAYTDSAMTSTLYVGTTAIALNRSSAAQSLTGITSIDGSAATLTTARNINGVSFNGSADILVPSIYDSNYRRITNPGGAEYVTSTSSITGAIRVTLPVGATNTMVRMTIKVYEYTTGEAFEIHCGGYTYNVGNTWANNPFAYIVGNPAIDRRFTVRFGYTAGLKMCVYIGELASTWSYPQVFVTDVQLGYSGMSASWVSGWAIGFESSAFENVTATVSTTQVGYAVTTNTADSVVLRDGSGNFAAGTITAALSGNATTATTLQTARNINGVSFNGSADITVTAAAGTLTGATLAAGVTASSLTSLGTLTSLAVSSSSASPVTLTRTGSSINLSIGYTTTGGTVYAGNRNGTAFAIDGDTNMDSAPWASFSASAATVAGSMQATNFQDANASYNVNLGSGGTEGRGLVAGYVGGNYGGIGYNVRHGASTFVAPSADTASYLLFTSGGMQFLGNAAGSAGRTITWSTLATLTSAGNLSVTGTVTGSNLSGTNTGDQTNITGNAGTVTNLSLSTTSNLTDTVANNAIGYVAGISLFSQTDGALYSQYYNGSWQHQIFGDYRTGQVAIRGKNNGVWQSWRAVLDATNYGTYITSLSGLTSLSVSGVADTATAASHYYVETATDGLVRPKTLANVQSEIVTSAVLGSGTANSSSFLRGDRTWSTSLFSNGQGADVQRFTGNGTWTKPSGWDADCLVRIQVWGGGGGSAGTSISGGGGGGGYNEKWVLLSSLGSTETVTIGAGGDGQTSSATAGGNTTFGSHLTGYGGGPGGSNTIGGGGGGRGAGGTSTAGTGYSTTDAGGANTDSFFGGGSGRDYSPGGNGYNSYAGGGGGAGGQVGNAGGLSLWGGSGGAYSSNGVQPGGGAGGRASNDNVGRDGGAGQCIVTVFNNL